jgi:thiamine monophosphate kinase
MVVDRAKIERLEKELEEAKRELWREDAERYRILIREMSEADKERILGNLTDRGERVLFGLEAPEEPKRVAVVRPAAGGGDLVCAVCGKSGLTALGLKLHTARMHKAEKEKEEAEAA